jgi:hypothetical protein
MRYRLRKKGARREPSHFRHIRVLSHATRYLRSNNTKGSGESQYRNLERNTTNSIVPEMS